MPELSKVLQLPEQMRAQLHEKLIAAGFGKQVEIAAWVSAQGYAISKSAIGRYSQRLRAHRMQMAIARETAGRLPLILPRLVELAIKHPDDAGRVLEMLERIDALTCTKGKEE